MYQNVDKRFFTYVAKKAPTGGRNNPRSFLDQCVNSVDTPITDFPKKEMDLLWYRSPSNIHVEMRIIH